MHDTDFSDIKLGNEKFSLGKYKFIGHRTEIGILPVEKVVNQARQLAQKETKAQQSENESEMHIILPDCQLRSTSEKSK